MSTQTMIQKIFKARDICKNANDPSQTQLAFHEAWNNYIFGDDGDSVPLAEKRARLESCTEAVLAEAKQN